MTSEQVADAFAFPKAVHHRVESPLQFTELGTVEDDQVASRSPSSTRLSAERTIRTGVVVSHARIQIR